MSYELFWDGAPELARAYREADLLRQKRENQTAWIHGLYVYESICNAAPILHPYAKRGTKARPYPQKPHDLFADEKKSPSKEKHKMASIRARMEIFAENTNRKLRAKKDP